MRFGGTSHKGTYHLSFKDSKDTDPRSGVERLRATVLVQLVPAKAVVVVIYFFLWRDLSVDFVGNNYASN